MKQTFWMPGYSDITMPVMRRKDLFVAICWIAGGHHFCGVTVTGNGSESYPEVEIILSQEAEPFYQPGAEDFRQSGQELLAFLVKCLPNAKGFPFRSLGGHEYVAPVDGNAEFWRAWRRPPRSALRHNFVSAGI